MNLVMSERAKHRLIGVVVLISIAVIILPAILKKSNSNFEQSIKIALKLPIKPNAPKVDTPTKNDLFKQVKIVRSPGVKIGRVSNNSLIAKASSLEYKLKPKETIASLEAKDIKPIEVVKSDEMIVPVKTDSSLISEKENSAISLEKQNKSIEIAKAGMASVVVKKVNSSSLSQKIVKSVVVAESKINKNKVNLQGDNYSIQVATFTKRKNADLLVKKLTQNGYIALCKVINRNNDTLYQVIVGKVKEREKAVDLKKRLASNMKLDGFIVKSGVS